MTAVGKLSRDRITTDQQVPQLQPDGVPLAAVSESNSKLDFDCAQFPGVSFSRGGRLRGLGERARRRREVRAKSAAGSVEADGEGEEKIFSSPREQ